ncbi:hypothetical protein G7Z17_g2147 [Cylindrodendrum hubeiense]|uniref:Choline transporter n=1 Tax=Cylindrodendrum hubeiense TaxID=595255 RepID=A0A9P5HDE3_9HYPO|nr:hypothetical protein G7Z17_g2147 [Cylindrodendrum hubeiense]
MNNAATADEAAEMGGTSSLKKSPSHEKSSHDGMKDTMEGEVDEFAIQINESTPFKKDMGWLSILAAGFNVNNSWLVIAATMTISLSYGPMNTVWGILAITPVYICIALTLAELVSAYPTTGGQYHWTYMMAPSSINKPMSYYCGFVSWLSWIGMSSSSAGAVMFCVYALIMNSDPSFTPKGWHSFLIFQANNLLSLFVNLFGKKILPRYYSFGFILSVSAFLVFTVTTLVMQKTKQDSQVVWTMHNEFSGWPTGVQFLIALAAPVVAFCPLDGAIHLVEEVKNAEKVVPRTILSALAISFGTSLVFILAMLYCISDFDAVLASPSGFPLFELWSQATSTTTIPIVFTSITMFLLPVGTIACTQVASMMTWSLARDKGLAFDQYLTRINTQLNAPIWALVVNASIMFLIGCLYLFSSLAYNSIVGVTVIFQQITMAIPTAFLLYHKRSSEVLPVGRAFKVPSLIGWIANIVTVLFAILAVPVFLFPAVKNPTVTTMNYGIVVVAGALTIAVVNWFLFARTRFSGPLIASFGDH